MDWQASRIFTSGHGESTPDARGPRAADREKQERAPHTRIPSAFLAIIGGSLSWFVAVGWIAYATGADGAFAMLIASVFAVVAIGLPALLVAVGAGRGDGASSVRALEWLHGRFETLTGRLPARAALVQVLLPITATAIGFTLIAIVLVSVRLGF